MSAAVTDASQATKYDATGLICERSKAQSNYEFAKPALREAPNRDTFLGHEMTFSTSNLRSIGLATVLALSLAACAPLVTQNPGGAISPANVVSQDGNDRVMLKGADVVAYFTDAQYKQGNASIKSVYEKITFYFSSEENKRRFDAEPMKYVPQYGGYCANGTAYGIPWGGDADTWRVIDGKLYIFGGAQSRDAFMLDPKSNVALADKYWTDEIKGSNAFIQRNKRLVIKVPHYRSDADLAAEIAKQKK